jgi:hypothetical protein
MVRIVLDKVSSRMNMVLVAFGWIAFCSAIVVENPMMKLVYQAIARVVPQAPHQLSPAL